MLVEKHGIAPQVFRHLRIENKASFSLFLFSMKKILFLLLACGPLLLSAQKTAGKVKYIAEHSWTKKIKYMNYLTPQQIEKMTYAWGHDDVWKEVSELYFSPSESRYLDSKEQVENYDWTSKAETYTITRNFDKQTIRDHVHIGEKKYVVEDTLIAQKWKIMSEIKEIAGHICLKAVTKDTIKNQTIVAWFAQDIPVPAGPERFCGLPGLILELDYNFGALVITASNIEFMQPKPEELSLPAKLKGKVIKDKDYVALIKDFILTRVKMENYPFWGIRYN